MQCFCPYIFLISQVAGITADILIFLDWYTFVDMKECCAEHYGWSQDCIPNSITQVTATALPVAATETFASPTLGENSTSDELNASDAVYQVELDAVYRVEEFFPVFDGGTTFCQNVGTPPAWMTGNFLKETKSECCQNYAFQWDYDTCLMGIASDAIAFSSYLGIS